MPPILALVSKCRWVDVKDHLRKFLSGQGGLVTVEWVALAGAVVIGGISVAWLVMNNVKTPASAIGSRVTACETYAALHGGSTSGCR
jgi:hypothetical protein